MQNIPIPPRKNPCVYRFFDSQGTLLYIGATLSVFNRVTAHSSTFKWFRDIASITIEHKDTAQSAYDAEKQAIRSERPLYNMADALKDDGTPKIVRKAPARHGPSEKEKEMAREIVIRLNRDYSARVQRARLAAKISVGEETIRKIMGGYVARWATLDKFQTHFRKEDSKAKRSDK